MNTLVSDASDDDEDDGKGMRLYQSIYETALRNNIPKPVIEALIRIYSYDVDFQHKAQPGDSFDVLYAQDDENDVMFAALTTGGEVKKYYRFQTTDDGIVDYYDETGKSAKKFLVRKPVATGIMRSGFGARNHPLLGYFKMHTGVDWAAPLGTAIYASGNGTVDKVGWESGYGKYVRIKHANGYETAYGHMTAFSRSTQPGARVRQGQVIGYVGSTGLSTGPHVHYEILVNGRFVDPLRVKLPRGRVLEGPLMAGFDKERERVDSIITRSSPRVAQNPARALISSSSDSSSSPGCRHKAGMTLFAKLLRGDRATQRQRRGDAMPVLDAPHRVGVGCILHAAGTDDMDRAVVEHPAQDRLVDIHRGDLVHVHLDGVPGDEPSLVDHAPVGHRDLGDPADEPGVQERHDEQHAERDRGERYQAVAHAAGRFPGHQHDAEHKKQDRVPVDDPMQMPAHDDAFARLENRIDVAHGRPRRATQDRAESDPSARRVYRAASRPGREGAPVYAACCATSPLKVMPCLSAEITTFSPSLTLPDRISSASGSCTAFWIARLSGRAP